VSSVGSGYTSVWHRGPEGKWTFYSTVAPDQGCARYFGGQVRRNIVTPIEVRWTAAAQFRVLIAEALDWEVNLTESSTLRVMNAVARLVPETCWQAKRMLKAMGVASRIGLRTGKLNLRGKTPNGQEFIATPQRIWLIDYSRAVIDGADAGPVGPLSQQASLNDFLIPQRGIFAVARAFLKSPQGRTAKKNAPSEQQCEISR
jgi:hypothetical protein